MAAQPAAEAKVYLHIGEPKTGTTFIQQAMWRNRVELAAQGVVLPGHHPQDHYRASQDLRGLEKLPTDPAGSWTGEWEVLASEAQQAGKTAVISHELFSAADAAQAGRVGGQLLDAAQILAGPEVVLGVVPRQHDTPGGQFGAVAPHHLLDEGRAGLGLPDVQEDPRLSGVVLCQPGHLAGCR